MNNNNAEYKFELQNLISKVVKSDLGIEWYHCKYCERDFPLHSYFFSRRSKNGIFRKKCNECKNINFPVVPILNKDEVIKYYNESIYNNTPLFKSFWLENNSFKIVLRYLVINVCNISLSEIPEIVNGKFLKKYKLKYYKYFDSL